ncbi:MAG: cysteine hydrolase [Gammaproteobacteria bacterium]|nr:cysteine hydrolase [Gammaproteobacteria bacterium]NIR83200.1 cysteine hydrolase [Gammaproteobacteria bacterium]NIR91008.1 cysteine hydrolase [Gammaproteobacteria bacterium]NIU04365.1 cysteine hydrolase [Gammaproteobacteria bacterium]NIV52588.1 isochorismatase family protein [Gammaproteobacteria bacterium]
MCDCNIDSDAAADARHRAGRRAFLQKSGVLVATVGPATLFGASAATASPDRYAPPAEPALPPSDMTLNLSRAALVVTDPQIDFLSPKGVTWGVVGQSVQEHKTVENIERLFAAAKQAGIPVVISPHYYYPTDKGWRFEGALEKLMHNIGMFDRPSAYTTEGFENSGADFLPRYKEYIHDGKTIITSPHKVYGPEANDLVLQLRKNHVDQVILAGMSANLCVESHLRELLEQGFEVAVVKDATAAAKIPEGDGYLAAIINFRYIANAVWSTDEAVAMLSA